jgi:hypothetical protein
LKTPVTVMSHSYIQQQCTSNASEGWQTADDSFVKELIQALFERSDSTYLILGHICIHLRQITTRALP